MYRFFIIIFSIFFFNSCKKEEVIHKEFWENGELKTVYKFQDLKDSTYQKEVYFPSGALKEKLRFVDGLRDDSSFSYYESGEKFGLLIYKDGLLNGCAYSWYEDGSLKSIFHFNNHRIVDRANYFPNGQIMNDLEYGSDGFLNHGIYYFENGNIRSCGWWNHNEKIGIWQNYDENGFLIKEVDYSLITGFTNFPE